MIESSRKERKHAIISPRNLFGEYNCKQRVNRVDLDI